MRALHIVAIVGLGILASAYRLPGTGWGLGIEGTEYHQLHPDEPNGCTRAVSVGRKWFTDDANWYERGMQVQCYALGRLFALRHVDRQERVIGIVRAYSVLCGVLSIAVLALIARQLAGTPAAYLTAVFVITSGSHLVTSFWARGQIQQTLVFFASIYFALRSRSEHSTRWLFLAGLMAGAGVGTRWSVALFPMLVMVALVRDRPLLGTLGMAVGSVCGFLAATAFQWPLSEVLRYARIQSETLVASASEVGPALRLAATVLATLTGAGLATSMLALSSIARVRPRVPTSIRHLRPRDAIRRAKQIAAADWTALLLVMVTQTVLIVTVKLFDARYTDLLPPFVAIIAGVQGSRSASRVGSKRWVSGALAILVGYQLVYAAGVLRRYTSDSRIAMNHSVRSLVPVGARIAISPYVPVTETMARYTLIPQGLQASAEWVVAMDLHAARYLTHSGSFLALGMPADCSAVYNCEGKAAVSFYQDLYAGRSYELVHHVKAPVWTPEMWLWTQLMGSRWMFTSDARLFRKMR